MTDSSQDERDDASRAGDAGHSPSARKPTLVELLEEAFAIAAHLPRGQVTDEIRDELARALQMAIGTTDGALTDAALVVELALERCTRLLDDVVAESALSLRNLVGRASGLRLYGRPPDILVSSPHEAPVLASHGRPRLLCRPEGGAVLPLMPSPPRDARRPTDIGEAVGGRVIAEPTFASLRERVAQPVAPIADPVPVAAPEPPGASAAQRRLGEVRAALLEELGCLAARRRPQPGQSWRAKASVEERLLARADALLACGVDALSECALQLQVRPLPDPELTWAVVFLFAAIEGDDFLAASLRTARAVDLSDPAVRSAVSDALRHAPGQRLREPLRRWLDSSSAFEREVATCALGARGDLTGMELARALDDPAIDVVRAAASVLRRHTSMVVAPLAETVLFHEDEVVVREGLLAGVLCRVDGALRAAVYHLRRRGGPFAQCALICAIAGGVDMLDPLMESAAILPSPVNLRALGWYGHPAAVPFLIGRLQSEDAATAESARNAIFRISGLAAGKTADIPLERLRDDWGRAQPGSVGRLRFGQPWGLTSNLSELCDQRASSDDRLVALAEIRARADVDFIFDETAFVVDQLAALDRLSELLGRGHRATGWTTGQAR